MGRLAQDLVLALRGLRRTPTFAATAVLVLGLGIGMAVAMFTVAETVLLRPLPVREQEQIVLPRIVDPRGVDLALQPQELDELRRESRTMSEIAGEAHQGAFGTVLMDGDRPLALRAAWVTGNFFELLSVRPALGRLFRAEEESLTDPSVLVISYDTWQRNFAGDSGVLGRHFTNPYTKHRLTVVGVAPAGLAYPAGAEYWSPMVYGGGLDVVARLAPNATPAAAKAEFFFIMRDMYRKEEPRALATLAAAQIPTFPQAVLGDVRPVLQILTATVLLLLLLACVNVSSLLLVRTTARGQEIAVRRALGARAPDIVRHLLIESASLVIIGGAIGYALAFTLLRLVWVLEPVGLPRTDLIRVEGAPVAAAVGATLLAVLLVGLLPALTGARSDLASPLRSDARSGSGRMRQRVQQWFVASQLALALVMLAGAGLLVRSLERLQRIDLGYRADHLSLLWLAVPVTGPDADAKFTALLDKIPPALGALPGVTAITPIEAAPFFGPQVFNAVWEVEGHSTSEAGQNTRIPIEAGGPGYFRTLQIPLLRGRGFLDTDRKTAPNVAIVSEGAARLLQLGPDAIGLRIRFAGDTSAGAWRTIVGVAGDIRFRSLRQATPTIYLPARQYFSQGLFAVRTTGPLEPLLPALRRAAHDANPEVTIVRTQTVDALLSRQRAVPRLSTLLLSGFGLVALLLAAIGLYGLMAFLVRGQTREIGVRIALGATPAQLRREVLGRALGVTSVGAVVGLIGAFVSSRLLTALLFQVSRTDPITLAAVTALLVSVGLGAAYVPARRAMRVDPAQALRTE